MPQPSALVLPLCRHVTCLLHVLVLVQPGSVLLQSWSYVRRARSARAARWALGHWQGADPRSLHSSLLRKYLDRYAPPPTRDKLANSAASASGSPTGEMRTQWGRVRVAESLPGAAKCPAVQIALRRIQSDQWGDAEIAHLSAFSVVVRNGLVAVRG